MSRNKTFIREWVRRLAVGKRRNMKQKFYPSCTELGRCLFLSQMLLKRHTKLVVVHTTRVISGHPLYLISFQKEIKLPSSSLHYRDQYRTQNRRISIDLLPLMDCIFYRLRIILPKLCRIKNVRHKSLFLNSSSLSLCSLAVKDLTWRKG